MKSAYLFLTLRCQRVLVGHHLPPRATEYFIGLKSRPRPRTIAESTRVHEYRPAARSKSAGWRIPPLLLPRWKLEGVSELWFRRTALSKNPILLLFLTQSFTARRQYLVLDTVPDSPPTVPRGGQATARLL